MLSRLLFSLLLIVPQSIPFPGPGAAPTIFIPTDVTAHAVNCNGSGTALSCTISSVSAKSTIIGGILFALPGNTFSANPADGTNTWTQDVGLTFLAGGGRTTTWSAHNVSAGSFTVAATITSSGPWSMHLREVSWSNGGRGVTDKACTAPCGTGASTAIDSGASGTTTAANEYVYGVQSANVNGCAVSAGSGYTGGTSESTQFCDMDEFKIVTSTGSFNATFTLTNSDNWTAEVATYKGTP
jgi:hypothetical protein